MSSYLHEVREGEIDHFDIHWSFIEPRLLQREEAVRLIPLAKWVAAGDQQAKLRDVSFWR